VPTNAHRVQVLLNPDLLEVVQKLSEEKGLSMGKTVALLAQEACMTRGLFSPGQELGIPTHTTEVVMQKTKPAQETDTSELSAEDMKLLKMLKVLKEMT
jgi:hypothetical protein